MSFTHEVIEPREVSRQDTLVLYPMPVFGNIQNTGSRLQETANRTGLPIVMSDLFMQNKKTIFDMAAKDANRPSGQVYKDMSRRRSDWFADIADKYGATTKVGFADSLAVAAIQGMHLHSDFSGLFNAVLLRDGWNLNRPTGVVSGIARYLGYQVRDTAQQRLGGRKLDIARTPYEDTPKEKSEVGFFGVLYNVSDVMRGPDNRANAIVLAGLPRLAMRVVCLDHGLSGSHRNQRLFLDDLHAARAASSYSGEPTRLAAVTAPGWHSGLLDPERGADDLNATLQLLD